MPDDLFEVLEGLRAENDALHIIVRSLFVLLVENGTLPKDLLIADLRELEAGQRRENAHADRVESFRMLRQAIQGAQSPGAF